MFLRQLNVDELKKKQKRYMKGPAPIAWSNYRFETTEIIGNRGVQISETLSWTANGEKRTGKALNALVMLNRNLSKTTLLTRKNLCFLRITNSWLWLFSGSHQNVTLQSLIAYSEKVSPGSWLEATVTSHKDKRLKLDNLP